MRTGEPVSMTLFRCHVILMLFMCTGTAVMFEDVALLFQPSP